MEQKDVQSVEEVKTKTTEKAETPTAEDRVEKTFTQKEFKEALDREVTRKTKGLPTKEEMKIFNEWKESQKTEADKKNELTQENITLKHEKANLEQLLTIIDKGIAKDEAEFIQFKVGKMEGDFDDNLNEFLEKNPKYLKKEENDNQEKQDISFGDEHKSQPKGGEPTSIMGALEETYKNS